MEKGKSSFLILGKILTETVKWKDCFFFVRYKVLLKRK